MNKAVAPFIACLLVEWAVWGQPANPDSSPGDSPDLMAREQAHFLECLSYVYSPALWFSYDGSLYFAPKTEEQAQQLEKMKLARSRYVALTDRQQRHEITAKAIAASGIEPAWQAKILLPFSDTNQNLTPTLDRPLEILPTYKLLQRLPQGDALIQDVAGTVQFIMNFGRAVDDNAHTNGLFIKVGSKTYTTQDGSRNTVDAFASVGLNAEEKAVLDRVAAEFKKRAAPRKAPPILAQDKEEFELTKARATDSNPFMQFLVAKAYLEGKGTTKDEKLGLEWMKRAAASGSGDAKSFLKANPAGIK